MLDPQAIYGRIYHRSFRIGETKGDSPKYQSSKKNLGPCLALGAFSIGLGTFSTPWPCDSEDLADSHSTTATANGDSSTAQPCRPHELTGEEGLFPNWRKD